MPSREHVNWAKIRVLAVTVAALLILATISYLLTGGTVFEPKVTLYLYLDDATGLAKGSPVRVDGISVGKVESVELSGSNDPKRVVRVVLKVDRDRLDSITVDSTAQASSDTVIGDKFVDITSGVNPQHLAAGAEITFKGSTELMKSIDLAQFQQQVKVIEKLLDDIEQGRTPLGQFIAGDDLYNQLRDKVRGLQESMHAAANTTGAVGQALYTDALYRQVMDPIRQLDESLAKLQSGQGSLGQMLRDNQQYEQARTQVADLRRSISGMKTGEMMTSDAEYSGWTKQVRAMIQSVDAFNASPMLTTSAAYDNFTGMARELQGTVKEFRENPRKFLRLKVF
ncbi:MAG: Mammalian cell entry related domain protein [Candidatus Solibacter sp.]|nr:Mammalian cell entry related domain protein [Candidatus Solibacter sp.]